MSETSQMLKQKTSELEAAVAEVQRELARADASRRTEAHAKLAEVAREAREWLNARGDGAEGDAAAADTTKAEEFLHALRMRRAEL